MEYIQLLLPLMDASQFMKNGFSSTNMEVGGSSKSQALPQKTKNSRPEIFKDYQVRILGIVDDIDNKDKLLNLLSTCVERISPYNYEG